MYAAAVSISHTHTQNLYRFIFLSVFVVSIGITLGFCYCKDNNNFCIMQKILLNFYFSGLYRSSNSETAIPQASGAFAFGGK